MESIEQHRSLYIFGASGYLLSRVLLDIAPRYENVIAYIRSAESLPLIVPERVKIICESFPHKNVIIDSQCDVIWGVGSSSHVWEHNACEGCELLSHSIHLLTRLVKNKRVRLIYLSSVKVFGNDYVPLDDDRCTRSYSPDNAYGASHMLMEEFLKSLSILESNLSIVVIRLPSVFGFSNCNFEKLKGPLVNSLIMESIKTSEIEIENPLTIREFKPISEVSQDILGVVNNFGYHDSKFLTKELDGCRLNLATLGKIIAQIGALNTGKEFSLHLSGSKERIGPNIAANDLINVPDRLIFSIHEMFEKLAQK